MLPGTTTTPPRSGSSRWPRRRCSHIYGRHPRRHIEADFLLPLVFRDVVDITLRVAAVSATSVTYEFEMSRSGEVAVTGRAVAVLLSEARGRPVPWPDGYRRVLLTAGPQTPELLIVSDP